MLVSAIDMLCQHKAIDHYTLWAIRDARSVTFMQRVNIIDVHVARTYCVVGVRNTVRHT